MNQHVPSRSVVPEYIMTDADFLTISELLKNKTGISLSEKKKNLVYSRLTKRIRKLGLESFYEYCQLIKTEQNEEEVAFLIRALTTNVTSFFREQHHFELLRSKILPGLDAKVRNGQPVRIWSAGCSAGQEPYSIAMEILQWMPNAADRDVKVLATDIDSNMVRTGQAGLYEDRLTDGLPKDFRSKYFQKQRDGNGWHARDELKELVTFRELNLFQPWPFKGTFDAIFCRNVVIYFDLEDQQKLWKRFKSCLNPNGYLVIGHSERLSGETASDFKSCGLTAYRMEA